MSNDLFYNFLLTSIKRGDQMKLEGGLDDQTHQRLDLMENLKEKYEWLALSSPAGASKA